MPATVIRATGIRLDMDYTMLLTLALAAVPALVMFYFVLKGYTYPAVEEPFFKDSTVITLLVVGLVEGFLIAAFYTMFDWTSPVFGVAFAFIQSVAVLLVLNLRRFHGKSDTVFYGYALGLGQGAGMSYGLMSIFINTAGGIDQMDTLSWFVVILFLVMQLGLMSSVGTNIGEGVARLRIGEFTMQAMLVCVIGMLLWTFTAILTGDNNLLWILPALAMVALAVYYFYRTVYKGMAGVVADVLRLEGRKRSDIPKR